MDTYSDRRTALHWSQAADLLWWAQQFSLVQAVVAAAKTLLAMALLGVVTPLAPAVVGLVSFSVYLANDLADREEDAVNCPTRSSFVADHPHVVAAVAVAALALGTGLAWLVGGTPALAASLVPLGASLLYSLPVTPAGRRLKDVLAANTVLVAGAWAVTVTAVPLALAGRSVDALAIAVCLFVYLRSFISVEVFNVRDVAGDTAAGVDTLPVVVGVGPTRRVLALFEGCSLALLVAFLTVPHATAVALAALAVLGYSLAITWLLGKTDRTDALCLAKDGEYLLLGLVALLV